MSIEQAFILSAGRGTRMGELGKLWPKPLWNIFETNLLGLQIEYVKSLGIQSICVNTHHQHEHVSNYIQSKHPNIKLSHEEQLLGSGGGVHKLLNDQMVERDKPLGVFNSDSYLFESIESWNELLSEGLRKKSSASLFMSSITHDDSYNAVLYDESGKMQSIEAEKKSLKNPHTYSGFGIVFPYLLEKCEGVSSFFSTVADYKNKNVYCRESREELIDFGTVEIYRNLIAEISQKDNKFYRKLKEFGGVQEAKIIKNGYGDREGVFNFAQNKTMPENIQISIGKGNRFVQESDGIGLFLD
ncbi:MAG: hypothetical protein EP319_02805 [Deltaproteobacteria bacterium]|nr:MAG: hypothetical protein EP319_02805 [Deltaproteobacteria bacterium]